MKRRIIRSRGKILLAIIWKIQVPDVGFANLFFMKTLCVRNRAILIQIRALFANIDGRGRQQSVTRTDDEHKQTVKEHIVLMISTCAS